MTVLNSGNPPPDDSGDRPPPHSGIAIRLKQEEKGKNTEEQPEKKEEVKQPPKKGGDPKWLMHICVRCRRTFYHGDVKMINLTPVNKRTDWQLCLRYHLGKLAKLGDCLRYEMAPGVDIDMSRITPDDLETLVWDCCRALYEYGSGLLPRSCTLVTHDAFRLARTRMFRGCKFSSG
ncbi:hypothetical protein QBC40DRAFT_268427, partial [Triangularia verruculosa]